MTIYIIDTENLNMHDKAILENVISGNDFKEITEEDLELLENNEGYNLVQYWVGYEKTMDDGWIIKKHYKNYYEAVNDLNENYDTNMKELIDDETEFKYMKVGYVLDKGKNYLVYVGIVEDKYINKFLKIGNDK